MDTKAPLPPFAPETARRKVRMAEDAWNTRDPDQVVLVYTATRTGAIAQSFRPDAARLPATRELD